MPNRDAIAELGVNRNSKIQPLNENEIQAINSVLDMYSKEKSKVEFARNEFLKRWDSYETLRKLRIWWENVPVPFEITKVGKVLAYTNAKRCDNQLPDLVL